MSVVTLKDIYRYYNNEAVLLKVSLEIEEGDFWVIFGEDDAGKTTLLRLMLGLDAQYQGSVETLGKPFEKWHGKERSQVRFVPDDIIWETGMSAKQYFSWAASVTKDYNGALQAELCEEFEVPVENDLSDMTYQENKLVQIIAAVCAAPRLLILDEPLNFLEKKTYNKLLEYLLSWNQSGMTIILAMEHYADARWYAKKYAYLREGELLACGNVPEPDFRSKVVTISGHEAQLAHCFTEERKFRFLRACRGRYIYHYTGESQELLAVLQQAQIQDVVVEEMTMEEEIRQDFSRWE